MAASAPAGRRTFVKVGGMTCSACSGTVEAALLAVPGVESAQVSLLTERAEVVLSASAASSPDSASLLVRAVEDVGFSAELVDSGPSFRSRPGASGPRKVFVAVTGMTCSACSGTVEEALRAVPGVDSAQVSLLTERAEVVFSSTAPSSDPALLVDAVEAVGFGAQLVSAVRAGEVLVLLSRRPPDEARAEAALLALPGVTSAAIERAGAGSAAWQVRVAFDAEVTGPRHFFAALDSAGASPAGLRRDGDIEARQRELEHGRAAEVSRWKRAFWLSMLFSTPVFLIMLVCPRVAQLQELMDHRLVGSFTLQMLLMWVFVTPVQFGIGARFYVSAYKSLQHGAATMDVLVVLGSTAAYVYSVVVSLLACSDSHFHGAVFFETSASLITLILLGRTIEHAAKGRTSEALVRLMKLQPRRAIVLELDPQEQQQQQPQQQQQQPPQQRSLYSGRALSETLVDVQMLHYGDILRVDRGSVFPVDGEVVDGSTSADESMVTGESMPSSKRVGDRVIGGTVNSEQPVRVRVTAVGSETVLSKIVTMVEQAQTVKAPIQAFADRVARVFVPAVVSLSLLTFATWYLLLRSGVVPAEWPAENESSDFVFAFMFAVAVVIISCPCALGLATPTAVMVGTGIGASHGVLFKGGAPMELAGRVQRVVFDKTGTLTQGKPEVCRDECLITPPPDLEGGVAALWALVASAESRSEHVLGRSLRQFAAREAADRGYPHAVPEPEEFRAVTGQGVQARVLGRSVVVGARSWLVDAHSVPVGPEADAAMEAAEGRGHTAVLVAVDGALAAVLSLGDPPRPEARAVVKALGGLGVEVYMCSGDRARTARHMSRQLGIRASRVFAETSPAGKSGVVETLREGGKYVVAFVGDGINDSPALASSDVGIAVASGTDIAVEAASVVLVRGDIGSLLVALDLSRATVRRIRLNFAWAMIYNLLAIPIAAGVFYPWLRMTLPPMVAAACMAFSSTSVILSSLLLKRYVPPSVSSAPSVAGEERPPVGLARRARASGAQYSRLGAESDTSGSELSSVASDTDNGQVSFDLGGDDDDQLERELAELSALPPSPVAHSGRPAQPKRQWPSVAGRPDPFEIEVDDLERGGVR